MNDILTFLADYEKLISIVSFIFMAVFAVLLYRKTGNTKYLLEVFEEMKYRTSSYKETEREEYSAQCKAKKVIPLPDTQRLGQKFTSLIPVYRLNKSTNELELTDEYINIDELVNSNYMSTLDVVLEKYLPTNEQVSQDIAQREEFRTALDKLQESFMYANSLREKYNLSEDLSPQQVFEYVNNKLTEVNNTIKANEEKIKKIKEIKENEKEIIEESK